jgi:hypothetical protein
MSDAERSSGQPRVWLWLFAAVLGVGLLQWLGGKPESRKRPGPARGDVVLLQNDLPEQIQEWKRAEFRPAMPPDVIPDGIYWWVHQWTYRTNDLFAAVSFDQLGEDQWHELTYCYRNQGRTIEHREVYLDPEDGGQYVVVTLKDPDQQFAVLIFSVFFEDGQWGQPPLVNISNLNVKTRNPGAADLLLERVNPTLTFENLSGSHDRALQCQVLVPCDELDISTTVDSAISLHLETRKHLRNLWLNHAKTLTADDSAKTDR